MLVCRPISPQESKRSRLAQVHRPKPAPQTRFTADAPRPPRVPSAEAETWRPETRGWCYQLAELRPDPGAVGPVGRSQLGEVDGVELLPVFWEAAGRVNWVKGLGEWSVRV